MLSAAFRIIPTTMTATSLGMSGPSPTLPNRSCTNTPAPLCWPPPTAFSSGSSVASPMPSTTAARARHPMMRHCFVAYALKKILKTLFTKPGPMWKRCRRAAARRSCGDEPAPTAPGGTHDEPQPVQRHPALDTAKAAVHSLTGLIGGEVRGFRRDCRPACDADHVTRWAEHTSEHQSL